MRLRRGQKALLGIIFFILISVGLPLALNPIQEKYYCYGLDQCRTWGGVWQASFVAWIPALGAIFVIARHVGVPPKMRNVRMLRLCLLLALSLIALSVTLDWQSRFTLTSTYFESPDSAWSRFNYVKSPMDRISHIQANIEYIYVGGRFGGWTCQREVYVVADGHTSSLRNLGFDGNDPTEGSLVHTLANLNIPIYLSKDAHCLDREFPTWLSSIGH